MDYFAQQLINGLVLGSIYGLIAIGYTMVYGIVGMINFAHGDIFMIGGFIALITFLILISLGLTAIPPDRTGPPSARGARCICASTTSTTPSRCRTRPTSRA